MNVKANEPHRIPPPPNHHGEYVYTKLEYLLPTTVYPQQRNKKMFRFLRIPLFYCTYI
jgi:hypothetical protein